MRKTIGILWYHFVRVACGLFSRWWFKLTIQGTENIPPEGGFVMITNHQSFLDPFICAYPLKRRFTFMARHTLYDRRLMGAFLRSLCAFPVRRGQADISTMKRVISRLRDGWPVLLFPEATRTLDGRIKRLKPGFGLLCRRGKTAVIPGVIDGAYECWPKGRKLFKRGHIVFRIGEPISPERVRELGDRGLAEELTQTLRRIQTEIRCDYHRSMLDYSEEPPEFSTAREDDAA